MNYVLRTMLAHSTMYLFIKKLEHTYNRKRTMQGEDNCFTDQNSARMSLQTSSSTYSCSERANESEFSAFILSILCISQDFVTIVD